MIKIYKYTNANNKIVGFILIMISSFLSSQTNNPPSIFVEGRQAFCNGSSINIVTNFTISDPDDTTIESFFIQISSGYQVNFDRLELTGTHPNILQKWNLNEGKLTLSPTNSSSNILLTDLENAVKDVVFTTSATNVVAEKYFSLSIGDANYLPSTDHFYQFVDQQSITWNNAKTAAENSFYYGRRGYLATLTSQEESDFAGKQASGAGWIGGSDEETEGEWKWVTGPEAGTVFWNGEVNGSSPNFAFWNNNEPNDYKEEDASGEDYAHITDPSIGIPGAWNDLPNAGGTDLYIPRGYIVEYGVPGDPPLNIVASTSIYIPQIVSTTSETICASGSATITATQSEGDILWFSTSTGGTPIYSGSSFLTPVLNTTTTFYATVSVNGCETLERTAVTVTVNPIPTILNTTDDLICSGVATLNANASEGQILWFDSLTDTIPIFIGTSFETPILTASTTYYVVANNSNCESLSRTPVNAIVNDIVPEFDLFQDTYALCLGSGSIDLETINPQGNYSYIWKKDGEIIGGSFSMNTINSSGIYSVSAVSSAGCESQEKIIRVRESEIANLTKGDILINENSNNNSLQIMNLNLGIGDYEFALDDEFGTYQNEGTFNNISTGMHTLFIKDKFGCGTLKYKFSVLFYPKFFTPNGDGENDVWKLEGYDKNFYTISNIYIYNRFGKLIHTIDNNSEGWNGNYQSSRLPSNDYWFRVILSDINGFSEEKIGNFSLIRK